LPLSNIATIRPSEQGHDLSAQQILEAQQALDVAAFNGILSLAIILRKANLLTDVETGSLHEIMSRPLSMPGNADNPVVQDAQQNLDHLFGLLVRRS
jgi:hypothetical protein